MTKDERNSCIFCKEFTKTGCKKANKNFVSFLQINHPEILHFCVKYKSEHDPNTIDGSVSLIKSLRPSKSLQMLAIGLIKNKHGEDFANNLIKTLKTP